MTPAKIVVETKRRIVCPHCDKPAGVIDHLVGTTVETRWSCDECGGGYRLAFLSNGDVLVEPTQHRTIRTLDLLVLKPQDKPVYFVVSGMRFTGETHAWSSKAEDDDVVEQARHKQFYYEEHSCPTNWFEPEVVYYDGDDDPHGLIEFVAHRDEDGFPADECVGPNDRDRALREFIETASKSGGE